jgi:outer membrane receptor protein involved in Fe transport
MDAKARLGTATREGPHMIRSLTRHAQVFVAAGAFAFAAAASAQEAPPAADAASAGIEEIIVTATKRAANIQDIPIAVTAISDVQIERGGLKDIRDLPSLSPSFNMNSSNTESGGTTLRMRGVGTTGNNAGLESAVGVFLDGVYFSRPGIALADLMDVEAIEVLRGPQGTLFGRNTSAGALHIRTKKPNLEEVEAWANATVGNFDSHNLQAGVSVPLLDDKIAARLAVSWRDQDGYMESITGAESHNKDRYSLRGQLLWAINDSIDLRLIGDYAKTKELCCDAAITYDPAYPAAAFTSAGLPADGGVAVSGHSAVRNRNANSQQFRENTKQWGVSAELTWDLGEAATLTSLTAYRKYDAFGIVNPSDYTYLNVYDVPGSSSGFDADGSNKSFSQEIRLQGALFDDRVDWMVGFYYSDEEIDTVTPLELGSDFSAYMTALYWNLALAPAVAAIPAATPLNTGGPTNTWADVLASSNKARTFAGGVDSAGNFAVNNYLQDGKSWSIFTHNTIHITDRIDAVVGLRWIDEKKDGEFDQLAAFSPACENSVANLFANPFVPTGATPNPALVGVWNTIGGTARALMCFPFATRANFFGSPAQEFSGTFKDDELAYTAALFFAATEDINVYFSYSHGFKAGGFNLDSTAGAPISLGSPILGEPRFASETVDAYEGGIKATLFDRMRANLAVFHQEMEDFQVLEFTGVQFFTFNVPTVKSTGFELETVTSVIEGLDIGAAVTYADARYPKDCAPSTAPLTVLRLCGGHLTNAPEWVGNVSVSWEDELPWGGLNYFVNTSMRIESDRRTSTQRRNCSAGCAAELKFIDDIQQNNEKVNARIGISGSEGLWTFELFANNLFDKITKNVTFNTPLRGALGASPVAGVPNNNLSRGTFVEAPRTYGATLRIKY